MFCLQAVLVRNCFACLYDCTELSLQATVLVCYKLCGTNCFQDVVPCFGCNNAISVISLYMYFSKPFWPNLRFDPSRRIVMSTSQPQHLKPRTPVLRWLKTLRRQPKPPSNSALGHCIKHYLKKEVDDKKGESEKKFVGLKGQGSHRTYIDELGRAWITAPEKAIRQAERKGRVTDLIIERQLESLRRWP